MPKSIIATNTATAMNLTPFMAGRNAVAINQQPPGAVSAGVGVLVLQRADTLGGAYTTLATVPADGTIEIPALPPFIRVSTVGNVTLIAGP